MNEGFQNWNLLGKVNNWYFSKIAGAIPNQYFPKLDLAFKSSRATKLGSKKDCIKDSDSKCLPSSKIETLEKIDKLITCLDPDLFLGDRITDVDLFRREMIEKWSHTRYDFEQQEAFNTWIYGLGKERGFLGKTKGIAGEIVRECTNAIKLATITTGLGTRLINRLWGDRFIQVPIITQAISDVASIDPDSSSYQLLLSEISTRYGMSPEDPRLVNSRNIINLRNSSAIFFSKEGFDIAFGYGVWAVSLMPFLIPSYREYMDANREVVMYGLVSAFGALTTTKAVVNASLLRNHKIGYSPDFAGTAINILLKDKLKPGYREYVSSGIGTSLYNIYQISMHTMPLSLEPHSMIAAWMSNVVDECFWLSVSGSVWLNNKTSNSEKISNIRD